MEKAGYSLRKRKPPIAVAQESSYDEESELSEEDVKPIKKRSPSKNRKKNPEDSDPDFCDEEDREVIQTTHGDVSPKRRHDSSLNSFMNKQLKRPFPTSSDGKPNFIPKYIPILPKIAKLSPPNVCSVKSCILNLRVKKMYDNERNVTIHPFPCQPAVRYNWIKAVRPSQPFWQPSAEFGVCGLHFAMGSKPWCGDPPKLHLPSPIVTTQNRMLIKRDNVVTSNSSDSSSYHQTLYGQNSKGFAISRTNTIYTKPVQITSNPPDSFNDHQTLACQNSKGLAISRTNTVLTKPVQIAFVSNGNKTTSKIVRILPKGSINLTPSGQNSAGFTVFSKPNQPGFNLRKINVSNSIRLPSSGIKVISNVDNNLIEENRNLPIKLEKDTKSEPVDNENEHKMEVSTPNILPGISIEDESDDDDGDDDETEDEAEEKIDCTETDHVASNDNASPNGISTTNLDSLSAITIDEVDEQEDFEINPEIENVASTKLDIDEDVVEETHAIEKVFAAGNKRLIIKKTDSGYLARSVVCKPFIPAVLPPNMPCLMPEDPKTSGEADVNQILGRYIFKGLKTFYCSLCNFHVLKCTRTQIANHIALHKTYKTLYECRLCGATFDSFKFLFCHWKRRMCFRRIPFWMATLNGNLIECWTCFICSVKSSIARCSSLIHHVETMHGDIANVYPDADHTEFKCVVCGLQSYTPQSYFNHVGRTHYHLCHVYQSDDAVSLKYLEEHAEQGRSNARYRGEQCDCLKIKKSASKQLGSTSEVLSNFLILERYKHCSHCSKDVEFLRQLIPHTYGCATKCEECSMKFYDFWSESSHRILHHWLKKCPTCDIKFDSVETEWAILCHFREQHKVSERELAFDRLCGYPTPLLFEDGAIYYCKTCHNQGNALYFSLQSCLLRYHRFMQSRAVNKHDCILFSGNTESCVRARAINHFATAPSIPNKINELQDENVANLMNEHFQMARIKQETDESNQKNSSQNKRKDNLALDWELQNAISIVEEDDEEDVEKYSDDVEIVEVKKPEPVVVDLSSEGTKSRLCKECNLVLNSMEEFETHMWQMHTNAEEFPCLICKEILNSEQELRDHLKLPHSKFFCWKCTEFFESRRKCVSHVASCIVETTPEKFKEKLLQLGLDEEEKRCDLCSLNFATVVRFCGHLRLHCCKYVAKCARCRKKFFQFNKYFQHRKSCSKL